MGSSLWSTMLILLIIMCLAIWTLGFKVYAQASSGRIGPKPHFVRMLSSVVHLLLKSKLAVIYICCEYDKFPRYSHSQGREKKKTSTKSFKKSLQKFVWYVLTNLLSLICNMKIIPIFKILPVAHVKWELKISRGIL